jgi:hypothetical protein
MKNLKMLGTAIAAMVLLGVAGASAAQASTSLYTDSAKTIPYPAGTVVDLSLKSGTSTTLKDTSGSTLATCTGSTAKGKTASETGEAISVSLETLSWSGCSTTTNTLANGSLEIKWTSGSSGEVIGRKTEWTVAIFGVSCTYGFGEGTKLGTIAGGEAPLLKVEAGVKKTAGSFLCPETATFAAEYVFTEPHAIYVGT